VAGVEPTVANPTWQLPTIAQFAEPVYGVWCQAMHEEPGVFRKQWEWVYILQVLEQQGKLRPGMRGLGFGCGTEPLAAVMANHGVSVLATDLDFREAKRQGWVDTNQHSLSGLNNAGICPPDRFAALVSYRPADMNAIPAELRQGEYDFVWSACSLEHLGSLEHGLAFIEQAMQCLKPGGVAVHTTEFNLGSNTRTVEQRELSLYRKRDVEGFALRMVQAGHRVPALNFSPGTDPLDAYVDVPPYSRPHIKLYCKRHLSTSIGLYVERGT
jgi:2-polyprenyl-3-methyl-5-hydroxy-6-metoxy-1,4-benzoquinol methylase